MDNDTWTAFWMFLILLGFVLLGAWAIEGYAFRRTQRQGNDEQVRRVYGQGKSDDPYDWRKGGL